MLHFHQMKTGQRACRLAGLLLALSLGATGTALADRDTRFLLPEEVRTSTVNAPNAAQSINGRDGMFLTPEEIAAQGLAAHTSAQGTAAARQSGGAHIGNCRNWVNVRGDASTKNAPIGRINAGDAVSVLYWNAAGDWAFVAYEAGSKAGWVFGRFIKGK